ncbi:hypothetical protein [Bifidobacterium saguini]|nr:hypothetical protein [Bifidobacterium saguini]
MDGFTLLPAPKRTMQAIPEPPSSALENPQRFHDWIKAVYETHAWEEYGDGIKAWSRWCRKHAAPLLGDLDTGSRNRLILMFQGDMPTRWLAAVFEVRGVTVGTVIRRTRKTRSKA